MLDIFQTPWLLQEEGKGLVTFCPGLPAAKSPCKKSSGRAGFVLVGQVGMIL